MNNFFRLIAHSVIIILLVVLGGKVLLNVDSPNAFLYLYGIAVTFVLLVTFYTSLFKYKDPYLVAIEKNKGKPKQEPLVSCMVAAFNEEKVIDKCVESFLNQTYKNIEIIFVNDKSTDATLHILNKYRSKGITILNLKKNVGKKRALGEAMRIAKGNIFAFSDSDSIIAPDGVERMVEIFNAYPDVGAVSGHCRAMNAGENILTKIQDSWYEGQYGIRKAFESYYGVVTCVSGPFAVFRKEAIFNFIPAWEQIEFLGQEFKFATDRTLTGFALGSTSIGKKLKQRYKDSDFVQRKNYPLKDWKILYTKSARSWTIVPDTVPRVFKQQVRWKKSFIQNTFFTGRFFWKKPFFPALFYYLHILFVLVGPFVAFRHLVYLPASGHLYSAILYLGGILLVGFLFGMAYKYDNRHDDGWVYRPLMSLTSTLILSWLIFYSALTIRKMTWHRG